MTTDAPYPRQLHRRVTAALADTPVVLVNGPRQSGKTTLVRQVAAATGRRYLTLDDQGTLEAARADPQGFVRHLDTVVIDEVQRVPALLLALKWTVDQDRRPGRFLITGSADVMSLPGVADSLAGRIEVLTLWPLAGAELCGSPGGWLDAVFAALAADAVPPVVDQQQARGEVGAALATRVLAGGYPEAVRRAPARRAAWARNYLDRIMQRDVRDIAEVDRLDAMPRLVQALAQGAGQPCNYTQLGGQLGLDAKTVSRYLTLLEQLYLVRRVLPWTANALSRLLKTPTLQFLDAGLLASLLRLDHARVARDRATFGRVLECHVYGELRRMASWTDDPVEVMTYRDKDQREVDFVLENGQGEAVGVEVKAAASVTLADAAGLRTLAGKAGPRFLGGVVLYDGVDTLPLGTATGRPLWAMPLSSLWLT
jgi:predicted AAA+ superfamily ATPase